jgi:hypothetical protein
MEVRATNFGLYNSQHLQHVQGEIARSVKPKVLRQLEDDDLSEEVFQKLLDNDLVELSPEAKEMLKQLRVQRKKKKSNKDDVLEAPRKDFATLLSELEEFRKQLEEGDADDPILHPPTKPKPFVPPVITLSQNFVGMGMGALRPTASNGNRNELSAAGRIAKRLIAACPRPELKDAVARELQVFGTDILREVDRFGVAIIVLDRRQALTDIKINGMHVVAPSEKTFDGRPWGIVRGLYSPDRRLMALGEELIGLPDRSTARHEFAHAYDHVVGQKNSRKIPLSVKLWNSFRDERTGLVSGYAGTNPAEYFAESVEAFFQPNMSQMLQQRDPKMHSYLSELFPN